MALPFLSVPTPTYLSYHSYPPEKVVVGFYYIGKGIENVVRIGRGGREGATKLHLSSTYPYFAPTRCPTPRLLSCVSFLHGGGEVSEGADAMIAFEYFMLRGKNMSVYRGGFENCSVE